MKTSLNFLCRRGLTLAAGLAVATLGLTGPAPADIPAGNMLYTVGTTFTSAGQSHVYLLWMPTDDDLLRLRAYSVWSKVGAANSPALYQPESWLKVQTDPTVIEAALGRAEKLGQDLTKLEIAIDGLFDIFTPGATMTRSEKLSMILQGAQQDARLYHDLLVLARLHPAVSLCLGAAYAGPANGLRTYEVRMAGPDDGPQAPDAARRVVGRVTLNPATYQPLPAPGAPVAVPFGRKGKDGIFQRDARAHLNARMRWATPDPLRQQSLLQFGYQVYRVDPAFYHSSGMDAGTMQAGDLANYATAFPNQVKRVSRSPVLIERMLTAAEAADQVNDPDTAFFTDDNRRFDPGGVPFNDGDEFQYLITAVDVLGRDGLPSPASLFQICLAVGPNPPRNLTVRDQVTHPTATSTRQVFGLSWQSPTVVAEAPIDRYDIFRWVNADDSVRPEAIGIKVGSVAVQAGREWYTFEDATLGVPPPAIQLNKPWWFTVRAVSVGACSAVPSPHSSPTSGVLRARAGPAAPAPSTVTITKSVPVMTVTSLTGMETLPAADPGYLNVKITLNRSSLAIDGADYYYRIDNTSPAGEGEITPLGPTPAGTVYLGSIRFKPTGDPERSNTWRIPLPDTNAHSVTFHLRARDRHGNLSAFVLGTLSSNPNTVRRILTATASHSYPQAVAPVGLSLEKHISRPLGQTNIATPTVQLKVSTDTKIWKVYRRIDMGPLVLTQEGTGTPAANLPTSALAVNSGEVSYFLQLIDANGFARPMAEMGHFQMAPVEPPAKPMMLPVEGLPDHAATLRWACSPHGVGRYHVGVAAVGITPADRISSELSPAFESRSAVPVTIEGKAVELDFRMYDTGPLLGNSSPEQAVPLTLEEGATYYFIVEAVATSGERSPTSNLVSYAWITPVADGGPDAKWPARPSPQLNSSFTMPLNGDANDAGIIIGGLPEGTTVEQVGNTVRLFPSFNLWDYLRREQGRPERRLLPCVVYRYQLPNDRFPKVSGDVSQVTPMLKNIAARSETLVPTGGGAAKPYTVVYDPYFKFDATKRLIRLHVPQPKIAYAKYRYLMVLFRDDGEIDSVVPTSTFTMDIN
jgi:hypothetical protein